ncbi:MAG: ATP-binding protein [Oligoflexia bacterium]|nr:ATP-binding protein [Oligoflexia bacterium]
MWFKRTFNDYLRDLNPVAVLPVKVLKGPRQVGKTSLLSQLPGYQLVLFDDLGIRNLARENPAFFLDQFRGPLILDEATLAPEIFPELKKRVDARRREAHASGKKADLDIWITGSNQSLLHKTVRESLAGRASYFDLNTLSLHELTGGQGPVNLDSALLRGGWPELQANPQLNPVRYLNDLVSTFIEKDIVSAAGIEKKAAFSKALQMAAGRVGQLLNSSDIAKNVGADVTTVQSWLGILQQNGIVRLLEPYFSNLNQRLLKSPKIYFEDVGLACRLQGWSELSPLLVSPYLENLVENLALTEISRFFTNRGAPCEVFFVRSKEKIEVDFLIRLPNNRFIAAEVKTTPSDYSEAQLKMLDSLGVMIVDRWVLTLNRASDLPRSRVIPLERIHQALERAL